MLATGYPSVPARCRGLLGRLARWLVGSGLAIDWPNSHGSYWADQAAAASKGAGIFAGSYIEPWAYRACIRSGGCPLPLATNLTPDVENRYRDCAISCNLGLVVYLE